MQRKGDPDTMTTFIHPSLDASSSRTMMKVGTFMEILCYKDSGMGIYLRSILPCTRDSANFPKHISILFLCLQFATKIAILHVQTRINQWVSWWAMAILPSLSLIVRCAVDTVYNVWKRAENKCNRTKECYALSGWLKYLHQHVVYLQKSRRKYDK